MKENAYLEGRKVRMQRIVEAIREIGGINHKKLVALASWDLGIKEKTLNEYMEVLVGMEKVRYDGKAELWKAVE